VTDIDNHSSLLKTKLITAVKCFTVSAPSRDKLHIRWTTVNLKVPSNRGRAFSGWVKVSQIRHCDIGHYKMQGLWYLSSPHCFKGKCK